MALARSKHSLSAPLPPKASVSHRHLLTRRFYNENAIGGVGASR